MVKILREELYEKIWNQPITHIAKEYGVSDSAIIKICKKMDVPRPKAGHWAKIKCGQTVKKARLPKLSKTGLAEYTLMGASGKYDIQKDRAFIHNPLVQYELDEKNNITVNHKDIERHPLYLKNQKSFNNARANDKQILCPIAKLHFDINVTKNTLFRALAIMDALIKAFEIRGWKLQFLNDSGLKMQIIVLDEKIEFSIEEKIKRIDHVLTDAEIKKKQSGSYFWPPQWDYESSGLLTLSIKNARWLINRYSWSDGKIQRVEHCLNKFCIAAIELAEAIKLDRERKEIEEVQREKERIERARLQQLRDTEINKREVFEQQADAWKKAEYLRAYIKAVENIEGESLVINDVEVSKKDWLAWANNYANHIDPIREGIPTIVEETDGMYWSRW